MLKLGFMTKTPKSKMSIGKRWFKSPWPFIWALIFSTVFFMLGDIIKLILPYTKYYYMPGFVADIAANQIRPDITYPLSLFTDLKGGEKFLVIPFYLLIGYLLVLMHILLKPYYKYIVLSVSVILLFLRIFPGTLLLFETEEMSVSEGNANKGSIENARRMPYSEDGYITYSFLGYLAGRTYVHQNVKSCLIQSFSALKAKHPNRTFVLGETGSKNGGPIAFHDGKQNGMEVDILLPFLENGAPYSSTHLFNLWNYNKETKDDGSFEDLSVDYQLLTEMISTIEQSAVANNLSIKGMEIHPDVMAKLFGSRFSSLLKNVFGRGVKKDKNSAHAYITVTFTESGKAKGLKKLLKKLSPN